MAITVDQFKTAYPDFDGFTEGQISEALALAEIQCPATVWDEPIKRAWGVKALTAYYLECQRTQQAMSAATAQSVAQGQANVSTPSGANDFDQNIYGQQFKRLRRTLPKRLGFAF